MGIGTAAPAHKLDVRGNIGHNDYMYHNGDLNTFVRFPAADQGRRPTVVPGSGFENCLELQPGVAIDHQGNIIVVPESRKYRIDGNVPPQKTSQTIYLVLRYRDPDDLHGSQTKDIVTEQFRLDEKTEPPNIGEIEICRFEILPKKVELKPASNVFAPGYNTLDLRYRKRASVRSQGIVKATIYNCSNPEESGLFLLLKTLRSLYSFLEGDLDIDDTFLTPEESSELLNNDLLYITESQFLTLEPLQRLEIQKYINSGGTILIDANIQESKLAQLERSKQELSKALAKIANLSVLANRQQELQQELNKINEDFVANFQKITTIIEQMGFSLNNWNSLPYNYPLKFEPFLFSIPPIINEYQNQIWIGEGIILLLGNLSSAWALDSSLFLSREILRNAQEMGINILNYAWQRKLLISTQNYSESNVTLSTPQVKTTTTNPSNISQIPPKPQPPTTIEENSNNQSNININSSNSSSKKRKRPKPSDNL